jgi:hypothetical protein
LSSVTLFRIRTEMHDGSDVGAVDNVKIGTRFSSGFNSGLEGWAAAGDGTAEWIASGGSPGGYLQISDWASGDWHFAAAPTTWSGNWTQLIGSSIEFDMKSNYPDYAGLVEIWCGGTKRLTLSADPLIIRPGGTSSASVTLSDAPQTDLVVSLSSSSTSCIVVPASVTVPRGQTTVSFVVSAASGAQDCGSVITASQADYGDARLTLRVSPVTATPETPQSPHAPAADWIDCPDEFPADNTWVTGKVKFQDAGGDINWAAFDVVSGDFSSFSFNPMDYTLLEGNAKDGVFTFRIRCNTPAAVTMKLTLRDAVGGHTPAYEFQFNCGNAPEPTPEGPPLLKPVNLPAGLRFPAGTSAQAYESSFALGKIFFRPEGTAYIFSNERSVRKLLSFDSQGRAGVYVESDLLYGYNGKAGVWLGGDVLVGIDVYWEAGSNYGGLYRLKPDGSVSEWFGPQAYAGVGDLIAAPGGGWYFSEFENTDNVYYLASQGAAPQALITAGTRLGGEHELAYDSADGSLYVLNSIGGWPFHVGTNQAKVGGIYRIANGQATLVVQSNAGDDKGNYSAIAVSEGGAFGHALYATDPLTGSVLRIGGNGSVTPVISGLTKPGDLRFNPANGDLLVVVDGKYLLWVRAS